MDEAVAALRATLASMASPLCAWLCEWWWVSVGRRQGGPGGRDHHVSAAVTASTNHGGLRFETSHSILDRNRIGSRSIDGLRWQTDANPLRSGRVVIRCTVVCASRKGPRRVNVRGSNATHICARWPAIDRSNRRRPYKPLHAFRSPENAAKHPISIYGGIFSL